MFATRLHTAGPEAEQGKAGQGKTGQGRSIGSGLVSLMEGAGGCIYKTRQGKCEIHLFT